MVAYWCILLFGFSALLLALGDSVVTEGRLRKTRQNYFKTLGVCNEPQFWASFCFVSEKKNFLSTKFPQKPFTEANLLINLFSKERQSNVSCFI